MRVLFYHSVPGWSGSARAFAAAAAGLAERGYQVTFSCPPDSETEERLAQMGRFETIPVEPGGSWTSEARRLRQVLLSRFVEVVFVHTEREHLVAAAATRWAERGAVVRRTPAGLTPDIHASTGMALRMAAGGFLFTSDGERQRAPQPKRAMEPVVADLGVDASRHDAVAPAATASLGGGAGARYIACVYNETGRARAATVFRTIALLAPRHPELRLLLVGPGSDHEDLRMHAAALRLTGAVRQLGEREDALSVLRAADLGWIVAEGDDGAYGALDCGALRIPVIGERGTVVERYVADGISGVLLGAEDAPALAATVTTLLASPERRTAMGNAGRSRVAREFTESEMVDGFQRAADAGRDRARWVV